MMPLWHRQVNWENCGILWVNCAVLYVKDDWKDSSEACSIACQNCAVYSVFPSGTKSHSKIDQLNWECIGSFWRCRQCDTSKCCVWLASSSACLTGWHCVPRCVLGWTSEGHKLDMSNLKGKRCWQLRELQYKDCYRRESEWNLEWFKSCGNEATLLFTSPRFPGRSTLISRSTCYNAAWPWKRKHSMFFGRSWRTYLMTL
jgi:hypothetical protein